MNKCELYDVEYKINDFVTLKIPTIGEIFESKEDYYDNVSLFVATPYDMMVQLDDVGIDFSKIDSWSLFCLLFDEIKNRDLSLIFKTPNLNDFVFAQNNDDNSVVLLNPKTGDVIDKKIHSQIAAFLRNLLMLKKNDKKPANEEAKRYLLERARKKLKRHKNNYNDSQEHQLENYIIALVNTAEFSYTYKSVLELTIKQFYISLYQIIKKVRFDNIMIGCYAGTVNIKELSQDELSWISN